MGQGRLRIQLLSLDFLQTCEYHIDIEKGVLKYRFPLKFEGKLCCSRVSTSEIVRLPL